MQIEIDAPRPRVLAIGLTDAEVESLRPVVGSITTTERMYDVHFEEHDVLIHVNADFSDAAGLLSRRIAFAAPVDTKQPRFPVASGSGSSSHTPPTRARTQFKPSHSFELTEFANQSGLVSLVRRSCWPAEKATYTGFTGMVHPKRTVYPLLRERLSNPRVLAGILEEEEDGVVKDSVFWLPDIARSALVDWVRAAFDRWRAADPDTFPVTAEWRRADQWSSPDEIAARGTLASFDAEEARRRQEADEKRRALTSKVDAAEGAGEEWRALLSESGDDLVKAVRDALELIGFDVIDSDALPQNKGKKREDLRVKHEGWTALVEVKGYAGATKSNDLQQLNGAAVAYAASTGSQADALWYVVNAYRETDPAQRETALGSREDDLATFAEYSSGSLIDTRDLFALRQLVATDQMSKEAARAALMSAGARFVAPSGGPITTENDPEVSP
ncbi:hypothetical protein AB0N59_13405 [Microbacterium sp. NPDC089321]|uniref:hypothetical protein n=1 Tax=Microbacterium sp. NPDC089321 TaxID=3155183 RepID=UPI003443BF51